MEDVITEMGPPCRFFEEDVNNFTPASPTLPSPFLVFASDPNVDKYRNPSLLVVALSAPSLYLFHNLSSKVLVGTLILPETSFSGNSVIPSLPDNSCNVYAVGDPGNSTLILSAQCSLSAERCNAVARLLVGRDIVPRRVVVLDTFKSHNFRGKLSPDEMYGFKLETLAERKGEHQLIKGLEYFPSGSVVDGLGAALLARCQMRNIRGTLCVTWPDHGGPVVELLKSILQRDVLNGVVFNLNGNEEDSSSGFGRIKDSRFDSELYT